MADTVAIPFPIPSSGYALNSQMRINLDAIVTGINNISNGLTNFNQLNVGTPNVADGFINWYSAANSNALQITATTVVGETYLKIAGDFRVDYTDNSTFTTLANINRGTSAARLLLTTQSAGGDPYVVFNQSGTAFSALGMDVSDSAKFKIAMGDVVLGNVDSFVLDQSGNGTFLGTLSVKPSLTLRGSSSGSVTVQSPASPTTWTMTLPTTSGTSNYVLTTDGSGVTSWIFPGNLSGLTWKTACRLGTTTALPSNTYLNSAGTITGVSFGALSIDSVTPSVNDRILIKDEGTNTHNGIYVVTTVGGVATLFVLTRSQDYNSSAEIQEGDAVFVAEGTVNATTGWIMTTSGTITLGTSAIVWTQFTGTGEITAGTGLTKSGNTLSLTTPVAVANGGTGQSSYTDGQLLIGNTTGNTLALSTLTGTSNQVTVTNGHGSITLATPQNIDSAATPTFGSETLTAASNQLVLGTTRTVTLTAPTPAVSSRVVTFPDLSGDYSVVGTIAAQTIAGAKTFSSAVAITAASNQIVLGTTNTITITASSAASRTFTIPDVSASPSFVVTEGAQTLNGVKTFSSGIPITATSAHLVLSTSSNTLTIQASAQATSARTWSVPDVSGSGTFAALEGTQTFSGSKTFSAALTHAAGSVSAPSINFGNAGTGFYQSATNQIGTALNGVLGAEFATTGTSAATTYTPLILYGGSTASNGKVYFDKQQTSSITTAATILTTNPDCALVLVMGGDSGGTNQFIDLILVSGQVNPQVISSMSASGSPTARTYTHTGNAVKLAMASGTYHTNVISIGPTRPNS